MSTKINKTEVLNRIKEHFGFKSNAKLAAFLGIAPTTLSSWYSRDTFDIDIIYSKCVDLNLDWLLTGRGTVLLSQPQTLQAEVPNDSTFVNRLFDTIEKKDLKIEELLKENARLEERLCLLEPDKSDFTKNAEDASTGSNLLHDSHRATSAGVPLKE